MGEYTGKRRIPSPARRKGTIIGPTHCLGGYVGYTGFLAVGIGGAVGSWLRWWLSLLLNPLFPNIPAGTLCANLLGGLLMGITLGVFDHFQTLPLEARLLVATGFLGGLTTFSTFSAETTGLLLRQQYGWFAAHVALHLGGSILMTVVGLTVTRGVLKHY
jgi:fluoride exporter